MPNPEAQYLSLKELSAYSSLSLSTLRTYLHDPQHPLPHYRLPRKILVSTAEFDVWLQRYRQARRGIDLEALVNRLASEIEWGPSCRSGENPVG